MRPFAENLLLRGALIELVKDYDRVEFNLASVTMVKDVMWQLFFLFFPAVRGAHSDPLEAFAFVICF